jgi:hypothetical protein
VIDRRHLLYQRALRHLPMRSLLLLAPKQVVARMLPYISPSL